MDQQERAFLSAALGADDERLERRLLVGFHLIRECCRIADDQTWVPRVQVAKDAMDQAMVDGVFVPGDLEFVALVDLCDALDSAAPFRPRVFSALAAYGVALFREVSYPGAESVFELLERLWTPSCDPRARLEGGYYQGLVLIRGPNPLGAPELLPTLLALRARAAREIEYVGFAKMLQLNRRLLRGNLPETIRHAERMLQWSIRLPSKRIEGFVYTVLAVTHGRGGRFDQVLRWSTCALAPEVHFTARLAALNLIAQAFMDLHRFDAAQAAFELLLLAPTSQFRRYGWMGLMDVAVRRGERRMFETCYRHVANQPINADSRINFLQVAGRGWAKFGDVDRARLAFDQAYSLAREFGYGYEIIETEDLMNELPDPAEVARAADIAPEVAAHVTALRDEHANEIAACMV